MPTGQSSDECDDTARISQLEHDIGKALEDKDTDRLLDLLFVVKNMNMTPRILKSSSIARLIQKVKKYHATAVSACASELVKNWKDIFKRSIGAEDRQPLVEYAKMSLDDFLEADIHVSPLKDRQYVSQQSCMSSRVRPMQGGVPSSSSSSSSPSRSTSPNRNPTGRVVYWMSRDQRLCDNWALLKAQEVALQASAPLAIVFSLVGDYPGANMRSYGFMLRNIKLLQSHAEHYNIPFFLLKGSPEVTIPEFCLANNVHTLVADFSPLRQSQQWKNQIAARLSITGVTCLEVDAHNICPCWKVSNKCEFSAKTIRGKIHGLLEEYLHEYPPLREHPDYYSPTLATGARPSTLGQMTDITSSSSSSTTSCTDIDGYNNASGVLQWIANGNAYQSAEGNRDIWTGHFTLLRDVDRSVPEVTWLEAGERASMLALSSFLYNDDSGGSSTRGNVRGSRLEAYGTRRNNPCLENGVSHLSAYLHFGQISAQRICLEIKRSRQFSSIRPAMFPDGERTTGVHCFCEELVVRRELSDNFCLYNSHYDTIDGAHNWARTTLEQHWTDVRPVVYAQEELEGAQTSDDLWNAAQLELVHRGKMHGFMRMYWAKKILEWTENPSEAVRIAIYLNDKYSLDGRDPNGYVGCMWAIAGVHDRAWGPERQVFGKIRYMNYDGCKRKFAVKEYIAKQSEWTLSSAENGD